ncbi:hypothetical protein [Roseovarius amoyensis]|uniref:hypothetical protein n=1 Tax=Roseovarius amoyensis TaxID=2211448 RepID=UPI0013A694B3|nr:hypothetical protein [Roseovarius amoyensis]
MMKRLVFDAVDLRSALATQDVALREMIADYRAAGFEIILSMPGGLPSHNESTPEESLGELQALAGLCDAIAFGGPGAGSRALHLDDKAVSPDEFLRLDYDELLSLVEVS